MILSFFLTFFLYVVCVEWVVIWFFMLVGHHIKKTNKFVQHSQRWRLWLWIERNPAIFMALNFVITHIMLEKMLLFVGYAVSVGVMCGCTPLTWKQVFRAHVTVNLLFFTGAMIFIYQVYSSEFFMALDKLT